MQLSNELYSASYQRPFSCVAPVVHSYYYVISLQKKYDLSDLTIRSLEDSEGILNAFEIKGKLKSWNVPFFHFNYLVPKGTAIFSYHSYTYRFFKSSVIVP